jgi:hypothetical protein
MTQHTIPGGAGLDLDAAFLPDGHLTDDVAARLASLEPAPAAHAIIGLIGRATALTGDARLEAARSIFRLAQGYPFPVPLDRGRLESIVGGLAPTDPLRRMAHDLLDPPMMAAAGPPPAGSPPAGSARPVTRGLPSRAEPPPQAPPSPPPMGSGITHAEPPGKPPGSSAAGPHVAYGLVRAPAEVVEDEEFTLEVGLSQEPAAGVAGGPLSLPAPEAEPYDVDVRIVARGFAFARGEKPRRVLEVSTRSPFPVIAVRLTPRRRGKPGEDRRISAEFSIAGERLGDAIRSIRVVSDAAGRTKPREERVEAGVNVLAPTGEAVADLTITVRTAEREGWLDWTFESPHASVTPPTEPLPTRIGDAGEYLRSQIRQIDEAEGRGGIYTDVLGLANRVAGVIPTGVWDAIRAAATEAQARKEPPTILIVSEEPYVPWELAHVDPPLPGSTAPPFLNAQARIGRWVQALEQVGGRTRPSPNPPRTKDVTSLGVVWGSYEGTEWNDLNHAREEAKELTRAYGAVTIDATNRAMFDLLRGKPLADLLHFAVHGRYEPTDPGGESGIILTDGETLHPNEIASRDLAANPIVFLNACQVGAGTLELGAYSGVAAAFVEAGASAVVAPLWSVDDGIAKTIALDFYKRAAKGETLSEVLRDARKSFVDEFETKSATYMAYQLFGHPAFAIRGLPTT